MHYSIGAKYIYAWKWFVSLCSPFALSLIYTYLVPPSLLPFQPSFVCLLRLIHHITHLANQISIVCTCPVLYIITTQTCHKSQCLHPTHLPDPGTVKTVSVRCLYRSASPTRMEIRARAWFWYIYLHIDSHLPWYSFTIFLQCKNPNPSTMTGFCNFFHWASPRPLPSSSPAATPGPSVGQQPVTTMTAISLAGPLVVVTCAVNECNWTCLQKSCVWAMCHKHCQALGGCLANHVVEDGPGPSDCTQSSHIVTSSLISTFNSVIIMVTHWTRHCCSSLAFYWSIIHTSSSGRRWWGAILKLYYHPYCHTSFITVTMPVHNPLCIPHVTAIHQAVCPWGESMRGQVVTRWGTYM